MQDSRIAKGCKGMGHPLEQASNSFEATSTAASIKNFVASETSLYCSRSSVSSVSSVRSR